MTAKFRYSYRIRKDVLYSSTLDILLPSALMLIIPGIGIVLAVIMIVVLMFLFIMMITKSLLKPDLEIIPDKLIIRRLFYNEEYDVERIQCISFRKIARNKFEIALRIDPRYLRGQRGNVRYLMTKRFGSKFNVSIQDIYNSPLKEIFDSLSREFPHLVQPT